MAHVDSILDLGNPNTLWSLGNHDYWDLDRVEMFTHRPAYYAYHKDGITFMVVDTQDSVSNILDAQKDLLTSITDTIQESSHLVILHHKLIWMYGDSILEPQIPFISNASLDTCFFCLNPNNFYTEIYPLLVNVKNRGIEVICIAGDIGIKIDEFEYLTPEGIQFLASGGHAGFILNKALEFTHDIPNRQLTWEYKLLQDINP